MNRRNFIKVVGLGAGSVALNSTLTSCSDSASAEDYGWNGPEKSVQDIRMQVLAYAIFCPNPHNIQPWIVHLTGSASFNLHVDPDRLLPETDPVHRQIHIGQGTFLETLAIAASVIKRGKLHSNSYTGHLQNLLEYLVIVKGTLKTPFNRNKLI